MATVRTKILTEQVNVNRSKRPISTIHRVIPLKVGDIKTVIFNKSQHGYQLIGLNSNNEPVRCWHDTENLLLPMISTKLQSIDAFHARLRQIKPVIIYTNDGSDLRDKCTTWNPKIIGYENTCIELLDRLKEDNIQQQQQQQRRRRKHQQQNQQQRTITFEQARELMPDLTRRQYIEIYVNE